jgi:hypothetical protein
MVRTAVLFMTHYVTDKLISNYYKLVSDMEEKLDVYWLFNSEDKEINIVDNNINFFHFSKHDLFKVGRMLFNNDIYGNVNFIPLLFHLKYPQRYDYYWIIEYDVLFTGKWSVLFNSFMNNDADLLSTHIAHYNEFNKGWYWWRSFIISDRKYDLPQCLKSFNPIYRLSNRAMEFLEHELKNGNPAHFETVVPTLLYNNGFRLEDIGGTGDFVAKENRNKYYIQGADINNGTMRYRPEFLLDEIRCMKIDNMLFHPIKWR